MDISRQELTAAAVVAAAAIASSTAPAGEFERRFDALVKKAVPTPDMDDLALHVGGCRSACHCDWHMRADCAWARMVRKPGDRFIVYDHDNHVISDANPDFKPTPKDCLAHCELGQGTNPLPRESATRSVASRGGAHWFRKDTIAGAPCHLPVT